jgi:hypothetical protein
MSRGRFGVDSFTYVDRAVQGRDLVTIASEHLKESPAFWGRYFKRPGYARDYSPFRENALLSQRGIKLLPIARQTTGVGGTVDRGLQDGDANVDAFIHALGVETLAGAGREFVMFLDIEDTALSLQYYIGWSNALHQRSKERSGDRFEIVPAVYARTGDDATWRTIAHAADLGHPTAGVWVIRERRGACASLPDWDPAFFMPAVSLPCPVLAWQFALDCFGKTLDFNMINPGEDAANALLSRLVAPK